MATSDELGNDGGADPAGIAVFRVAFERWVDEANQQDLPQLIRESLAELKAVTSGG